MNMARKYEYTNYYYHCGTEWEDGECDSMHNDRCPVCNAEIEPYKSMDNKTFEDTIHADLDKLKAKANPRQKLVHDAMVIYDRIKDDTQIFDVKTQSVHTDEEVRALKAALKFFIESCDRDFKVSVVANAGRLNIRPGDSPESVLQQVSDSMQGVDQADGILFKGSNGRWYTVALEQYIIPAPASLVKETLPKRPSPSRRGGNKHARS
jgi:hypothetical protein